MAGGNTTFAFYLQVNTHANRPAAPVPAPNTIMLYFETDTNNLFVWTGSWVLV